MFDWQSIDTILLDMDGTLLDLHFDNQFWQGLVPAQFAKQHQLTLDIAKIHLAPRFKATEGCLDWYCLDYWSRELQLDIIGLKQELAELIAVHPYVREFLQQARLQGKRLVLVTNAHPASLDLKMQKTALADALDDIVSSHDLGLAKEQSGFWQALQKQLGFDPQRSLLIDDSVAVLQSAQQFGIGQLLAISKPDSHLPARTITEFPSLEGFEALLQDWIVPLA